MKKILLVENQYDHYKWVYTYLCKNANYSVFPCEKEYRIFIENVQIILDRRYTEEYTKIALDYLFSYITNNDINILIIDQTLNGHTESNDGIYLAQLLNNNGHYIPIIFFSQNSFHEKNTIISVNKHIKSKNYWVEKGFGGSCILDDLYLQYHLERKIDLLSPLPNGQVIYPFPFIHDNEKQIQAVNECESTFKITYDYDNETIYLWNISFVKNKLKNQNVSSLEKIHSTAQACSIKEVEDSICLNNLKKIFRIIDNNRMNYISHKLYEEQIGYDTKSIHEAFNNFFKGLCGIFITDNLINTSKDIFIYGKRGQFGFKIDILFKYIDFIGNPDNR